MARKIEDIKREMTDKYLSYPEVRNLYGLPENASFEVEFKKTSLEDIFFYICAYCAWTLEKIFDTHAADVSDKLMQLKPHTPRWYRNKALAFQYGFDLITDSDNYNNVGKTTEQIAASKIVKYAAVVESESESRLIVKIATESAGKLQPITTEQQSSFNSYINEIKDAGVRVSVINYLPDRLTLNLKIYRDPLVLDSNGTSILTGKRPVEDAINEYLKALPFNGELVLSHLIDKLQATEGVKIPHLVEAKSKWFDGNTNGYGAALGIDVKQIPNAGYFEVSFDNTDFKSTITYVV